jgi:cell division transport system permease protein
LSPEKIYRKKKKLGRFPSVSILFSSSLALFAVGVFGLLLIHAHKLGDLIKQNIEVHVYLSRYIAEADKMKINTTLATKPYINTTNGSPDIKFISKEQAAKEFSKATGEDFVNFLGDNPLRDVYVIRVKPTYFNDKELRKIKLDISGMAGVFEVEYIENLVTNINDNIAKISLILLGVAILLILIVILIINNTIKLALFSQRFLIRSMQLVGAKSSFIRRPFLGRSILYGFLSGIISSGLLFILLEYVYSEVEGLFLLSDQEHILILVGIIILLGGLLNFMSTFGAIRKYMRLSLDELY